MKHIEIRLPRYLLVLTEQELRRLLERNPDIWAAALKRGKAVIRARKARARSKTAGGKEKGKQ